MTARRGFMFIDAALAIVILALAAAILAGALSQSTKARRLLSDQQHAQQLAATVLLSMQTGEPLPAADPVRDVRLIDLPDAAPDGWRWVRVETRFHESHAQLIGLIRRTP